ncbi:Murein DD-endopeptidase MepM [Pigmentiphaga humi]|uniref:Murein DD-endopeptidase MepM n=1 Tax=Pigmentiphaga humi TaxID=2478468 RepID=A0A3P4B1L6_9BURK|nr:M23 family metallopeptidase [Pigmentiphaga humi]VCU69538.1 Murein DD-endopeptidase MepM [Pigmentiphaga humi]
MQIIIVHPRLPEARTLTITPRLVAGAAAAALAAVVVGAALLHYATSSFTGSQSGPSLVEHNREQARQQAVLKENINVLAKRVGEMQAKLMQLDALGERVAGLAGVTPAFSAKGAPGRGGLLVDPHPMSPQDVSSELDRLESQLAERSDYLSVLDAQLTTLSVRKSMTPTVMPVAEGYNGSSFGWRIDPFTGTRSLHEGIDFTAPRGTPIVAAAGGVVLAAEYHAGYGYMVDIDHGNDLITRYAHSSKLLVKPGDLVKRGQRVALVGSTGRSTGSHLHFEVRLGGVAVNPNNFLAHGPGKRPVEVFSKVVTLPAQGPLD